MENNEEWTLPKGLWEEVAKMKNPQLDYPTGGNIEMLKGITFPVESKYFTPSIGDIRIGYECELFWNQDHLTENFWDKIIVGDKGLEDINWEFRIDNNQVRVLYLTKEQIQQEGWKLLEEQRLWKGQIVFEKGNYFMLFHPKKLLLDFILKDPSKEERVSNPEHFRLFCICKDTNRLREIEKILTDTLD